MPASSDSLSILLLCDDRASHAPNVLEHIRAFPRYSRHRYDLFDPRGIARSRFLRMDDYDVVVVHYTVPLYLSEWFREQIAAFDGLKVQFIQDEYRRVDAAAAQMRELGIGLLFSSVPADAVPSVYGERLPGVDIVPTLTGYVPAGLDGGTRPPLEGRPLDVVYRGRSIQFWLGRLGQDKVRIGRGFLARAASTDLRCDIAWTEADRIYGDEWYRFLGSSRSTLGTESGASIVDFDGKLQERTDAYLAAHPGASFDEVEREILAPFEGNAVIEAISPRVFEAAALGTAMVNFPGRYSDVIEPWVHYVPLEKDFSNFYEVAAAIRDESVLDGLAERAHEDLVASGRYSLQTFVHEFDRAVGERLRPAQRRPRSRVAARLNRSLRSVEHLRSPMRVAELPFVMSQRKNAAKRAVGGLIERFPEIAALADAEAEAPRREKLVHDLERLATASAAHVRELRYLGRPFDIRLELDDEERRLTLVGTKEPAQSGPERREIGDRVGAAIREQRLEELVWNNSEIGGLTFLTVPVASLDIGYHVTGATHRFSALIELARREPERVIAALEPLFRPRPDAPVHELDHKTALLAEAVLRPGPTAARGAASARATLGSRERRRLLRAYLGSPEARAEAPVHALLKDLFRLELISESPTVAQLDDDGKRLVYRTDANVTKNGGALLDPAIVSALEEIVWDHSAAGPFITSKSRPRISITLDGGVHEFEALTLVARRFPELAAPALQHAAGG